MHGEPIATFRLKDTSRWLAENNYQYVAGTNGIYRRISNWGLVSESESEWLYYIIETLRKGQASLLMRSCTEAM
jgi:hypothetical protein